MQALSNVLPLARRDAAAPEAVNPADVAGVLNCETHGEHVLRFVFDSQGRRYSPVAACPGCVAERKRRDEAARTEPVSRFERIPPRFEHSTLANYRLVCDEARHARAVCHAYVTEFEANRRHGKCMAMIGNTGTGKTHLAHAMARELRRRGNRVLYATTADIVTAIRDTWGNRGEGPRESDVLAQFAEADLLIMDEVGRQLGTRGEDVHLFQVLDRRYEATLPTVVLSNYALEQVRAYLTEAGFDRLTQGGADHITFGWSSQRADLEG